MRIGDFTLLRRMFGYGGVLSIEHEDSMQLPIHCHGRERACRSADHRVRSILHRLYGCRPRPPKFSIEKWGMDAISCLRSFGRPIDERLVSTLCGQPGSFGDTARWQGGIFQGAYNCALKFRQEFLSY